MKKMYRIEGRTSVSMNDSEHLPLFRHQNLFVNEFEILKETPKGYWINYLFSKKWVQKEGRNVFARISKEQAKQDFILRKQKQIRILETSLSDAKTFLSKAKNLQL